MTNYWKILVTSNSNRACNKLKKETGKIRSKAKAAVKHEHNNGYGQPATVNHYTMKDSEHILCKTSISSTGAIINCNGEP